MVLRIVCDDNALWKKTLDSFYMVELLGTHTLGQQLWVLLVCPLAFLIQNEAQCKSQCLHEDLLHVVSGIQPFEIANYSLELHMWKQSVAVGG